jgi:hypothetical protein
MSALPRVQQSSIDEEGITALRYSPVLRVLDRPLDSASRVESQELIRCELMRALDAALREQPLLCAPRGSEPIRLREKSNPFLGLPTSTPWQISEPVRPRASAHASIDIDWRPPRRKRRSRAPYALLVLVLAIGVGHVIDRPARVANAAAVRASARSVTARVVGTLPARLTSRNAH